MVQWENDGPFLSIVQSTKRFLPAVPVNSSRLISTFRQKIQIAFCVHNKVSLTKKHYFKREITEAGCNEEQMECSATSIFFHTKTDISPFCLINSYQTMKNSPSKFTHCTHWVHSRKVAVTPNQKSCQKLLNRMGFDFPLLVLLLGFHQAKSTVAPYLCGGFEQRGFFFAFVSK